MEKGTPKTQTPDTQVLHPTEESTQAADEMRIVPDHKTHADPNHKIIFKTEELDWKRAWIERVFLFVIAYLLPFSDIFVVVRMMGSGMISLLCFLLSNEEFQVDARGETWMNYEEERE